MKRAISTILFFAIIFTLSFSAIAKDDNNTIDNTIERGRVFLSKLDTLLQRYSNIEPKDTTLNLQMTDADSQTYKSSRLVVLGDSDEPLNNDFGAVEKVEGYAGLHILQYNNEDEATFAYNGLKSNSIIRYIEYDFQYYTEDTIDEAKLTASSSMDQWNCWGVNVVFSQLAMQEISDFHIETSPVVVAILGQHRTIGVCGLRSKIFRQVVQKDRRLADASQEIFVQHDGNRFKQGVRRDLCGVALEEIERRDAYRK